MTDIHPPSQRSERELKARLLAAGGREQPSARSLERTLSALGLGTAALGASGTAAAAAATSTAAVGGTPTAAALGVMTVVKFVALGAAGGLLLAAGAEQLTSSPASLRRAESLAAHSTHISSRAQRAPAAHSPSPVAADRTLEGSQAAADPTRDPSKGASSSAELKVPSVSSGRVLGPTAPEIPLLAPEIAFVDRGRAAFHRGELAATLAMLEGYERSFTDARLLPEVLYLRMEALHRSGRTTQAVDLAWRLVREFPRNPQAARARAVIDGARQE